MTPQEQLQQLLNKLETATGRGGGIDASQVRDVESAIKQVTQALKDAERAVTELADGFSASLRNITEAKDELQNIGTVLRGQLRTQYNALEKSTLNIAANQKSLLNGWLSERKAQNQLNKIVIEREKLLKLQSSIVIKGTKEEINALTNQKEKNNAILEGLDYTQSTAQEQLNIIQYSEAASASISKYADILREIPIVGKLLAEPFKDIGEEITNNAKKQQLFTQSINVNTQKVEDLKDKLASLIEEGNVEGLDSSSTIEELIKGGPGKIRNIALEIQRLTKETGDFQNELDGIPSTLSIIGNKIKKISLQSLALAVVTKALVTLKQAFIEIDDQSTQLARSLSISKGQGVELRNTFNDIAVNSSLMTKELVNAQLNFTKLTGAASVLSTKNLETLAESAELIKLSEDAQKGLINIASTTGEEYKDIENTILGTSKISQIQNGMMMDQKAILEEVLSTSYSLRVQFGNSVEELTKAVVEAKRLGFNLKDIEGVQQNLLSFESSIAAELEAELLTGKELNLEKARYFALTGNIKGLTQEINKQLGGSAEFERMNVLQRESFAKSLGLSADKLAEILYTQEQNDAISRSINNQAGVKKAFADAELEMNAENLAHLMATGEIDKEMLNRLGDKERLLVSQLSTQEQFNRATENLKEIFVSLMQGPVGNFMTGMNSMLDKLNNSTFGRVAAGAIAQVGIAGAIGILLAGMLRGATPMNPLFVKDIFFAGAGGFLSSLKTIAKGFGILGLILGSLGMISDAISAGGEGGGGFKQFFSPKNIGRIVGGIAGAFFGGPAGAGLGMWVGGLVGEGLGDHFGAEYHKPPTSDSNILSPAGPSPGTSRAQHAETMQNMIQEQRETNQQLASLNKKDPALQMGIQQLSSGVDMYAQRAGSNPGAAIT